MKKISVLWLVEHIAREMDVACAVKTLAEAHHGIDITIRNMYLHANQVLAECEPAVVVHPFFYFAEGALATEDYVRTWPMATHFNLAWEEIHYKAHKKIKAPSDDFTKKNVLHHAWGNFYKDYLVENGVPEDHIFVNGHPAYQLYKSPYSKYYKDKGRLSKEHGLDESARWIFVPENYRWAFVGNKVKLFTRLGADPDEIVRMRDFSLDSLKQVMRWCNEIAGRHQIELIFRPRPSTNSKLIKDYFRRNVGRASKNLHFIKDGSVREWILASDVVVSSYSTSLIEASIAGKPAYMVEPIPIPDSLYYDWYRFTPRIHSADEFEAACMNTKDVSSPSPLRSWAESEMLANGDPIRGLTDVVGQLVDAQRHANFTKGDAPGSHKTKKDYFNQATHENDVFDEQDVQGWVRAWREVLVDEKVAVDSEADAETVGPLSRENVIVDLSEEIINKTMCRDDLLSDEAEPVIQDLNRLIREMYAKDIFMSSWVGTLPSSGHKGRKTFLNKLLGRLRNRGDAGVSGPGEANALKRGMEQRLGYEPLKGAEDDVRIPWFLYWEIFWVLRVTEPFLSTGMNVFDAGGTSSLFSCYLGSLGFKVHSVDLNKELKENGERISQATGWEMNSYTMNMRQLDFPDRFFDHAYSLCVFEHLDYDTKQAALAEIARCLKPGGLFSITFDYRNPAPGIFGYGKDTRPRNQLKAEEDIRRSFLSSGHFELIGNQKFYDNDKSYLIHHRFDNAPYTFGAIFMRKIG